VEGGEEEAGRYAYRLLDVVVLYLFAFGGEAVVDGEDDDEIGDRF
jgi:hypothetical protein